MGPLRPGCAAVERPHGSCPHLPPALTTKDRMRSHFAGAGLVVFLALVLVHAPRLSPSDSVAHSRPAPRLQASPALPAAAELTISRQIGAQDPRFAIDGERGDTLGATGAGLRLSFGRHGVSVVVGEHPALRLGADVLGRGGSLRSLPRAVPRRVGLSRVSYDRGDLHEWYANGPFGLEQGFTLIRRPAGRGSVELGVGELMRGVRGVVSGGGEAITLSRSGRRLASYSDLTVRDARGRPVRAWLTLHRGRIGIAIADRGAAYPLRIDPIVASAGLAPSDGGDSGYGASVALSGNTIVVGDDGGGSPPSPGAAYVFTEPAGGWQSEYETAKLTASDGASGDAFGLAVAMSGGSIVVGAPEATVGGQSEAGAVYEFTEPAGGWKSGHETAKLTDSNATAAQHLGSYLAIDGGTVVANGKPEQTVGTNYVDVFAEPADGWVSETQTAELSDSTHGQLEEVGISDGTVLAFFASGITDGFDLFTEPQGGWSSEEQTGRLEASDESDSTELGTVAYGPHSAYTVDHCGRCAGAIDVFTEPTGGWSSETELAALSPAAGYSVQSVEAADDSTLIAFECPTQSNGGTCVSFVYVKPSSGWYTGQVPVNQLDGGVDGALSGDVAVFGGSVFEAPPGGWGAVMPTVQTGSATPTSSTSVTVSGTVNPNGSTVTNCQFEYSPESGSGAGLTAPCAQSVGSGTSPVPVSANLTGLAPGTTYTYALVASNDGGTATGTYETFTTGGPAVTTGSAGNAYTGGEQFEGLNGTVNPNGQGVSDCHFDYGVTTAYGSTAPCSSSPGAGSSPFPVSADIVPSALVAGATYHYRLDATAGVDTSQGQDATFVWQPTPMQAVSDGVFDTQLSFIAEVATGGYALLQGELRPGTSAPTSYQFEYGPIGGPNYYTPLTTFTGGPPGSDLLLPGAQVVTARVTNFTHDNVFKAWQFRLIAVSGSTHSYGDYVPFEPGNLDNPPHFDPSGPWVFDMQCHTSCGQAWKMPDRLWDRAGDTGEVQGILTIGSPVATPFDHNPNDQDTWYGTLEETEMPGFRSVGFQPEDVPVKVRIVLGTMSITWAGNCSTCTEPTVVKIAGAIDYGNPSDTQGNQWTYLASGGGGLGKDNTWKACSEQSGHGSTCNAPDDTSVTKQWAGYVGDVLGPAGLATAPWAPVSLGIGVLGLVAEVVALDPPDPHFHHVARPPAFGTLSVGAGHGLTRAGAHALSQLATSFAHAGADGEAFIVAWQRYEGALAARKLGPIFTQLAAVHLYGARYVADLHTVARLLSRDHRLLAASAAGRQALSGAALRSRARSMRAHGLPHQLTARLEHAGVPAKDVRHYLATLGRHIPNGRVTMLSTLLSPKLQRGLLAEANAVARLLSAIPG